MHAFNSEIKNGSFKYVQCIQYLSICWMGINDNLMKY